MRKPSIIRKLSFLITLFLCIKVIIGQNITSSEVEIFPITSDSLNNVRTVLFDADSILWIGWKSCENSWQNCEINATPFVGDSLPDPVTLYPLPPYEIWGSSTIDITVDSVSTLWILSSQVDYDQEISSVVSYLSDTGFVSTELPKPGGLAYEVHSLVFLDGTQPLNVALTAWQELWILGLIDSTWFIASSDTQFVGYGSGFGAFLRSVIDPYGQSWILAFIDASLVGNYWHRILLYSWSDSTLLSNEIESAGSVEYWNPEPYLLGCSSIGDLYVTYRSYDDEEYTIARVYGQERSDDGPEPFLKKEWELLFTPKAISSNASPVAIGWTSGNNIFVKTWEDTVWFETVTVDLSLWGLSSPSRISLAVDDSGYVWVAFDVANASQRNIYLAKVTPSTVIDSSMLAIEGLCGPWSGLPESFILSQNYPNPFNSTTTIQYTVPARSNIRLQVFDVMGRAVTELSKGVQEAGVYRVRWNGKNNRGEIVSSGIYFVQLSHGDFHRLIKMVLLR